MPARFWRAQGGSRRLHLHGGEAAGAIEEGAVHDLVAAERLYVAGAADELQEQRHEGVDDEGLVPARAAAIPRSSDAM